VLWIAGVGSRMAFEEFTAHGGEARVVHFSVAHDITSQNAWVAGLVLMALAEVISRLVTIRLRAAMTRETGPALGSPRRAAAAF
jgi:hypothetical protein